jgi:HTH-type transcriptional regulator/antitoxin HipB
VELKDAADLGALVRASRTSRRMSQQDLADAAGVSRRWLVNLEAGKPGAELGLALRVLSTLGIRLVAEGAAEVTRERSSGPGARPAAVVDLDVLLGRLAGPT